MTLTIGRRGERLAEQHLVSIGAEVLERNYRVPYAEVDLILKHQGDLVAVEVKSRNVADLETPEEAIHHAQLRRIIRGLTRYAHDNDLLEMPCRIDVVLIVTETSGDLLRFEHLQSVYPW